MADIGLIGLAVMGQVMRIKWLPCLQHSKGVPYVA